MDIILTTLTCRGCGHEWVPRVPVPMSCPRCKSRDWASPRPGKTAVLGAEE